MIKGFLNSISVYLIRYAKKDLAECVDIEKRLENITAETYSYTNHNKLLIRHKILHIKLECVLFIAESILGWIKFINTLE